MTTEIAIREDLKKDANNAIANANAMEIKDNKSNEAATVYLKGIKTLQKEIEEELKPAIDKAYELHRTLTTQKKKFLDPLQVAEKTIKQKISKFLQDCERIRLELQRITREKAEAEERKAREAKEKQQREWEAKEKAKREEAEKLEAEGKVEEARKAREVADKAAAKAEEREQQAEQTFVPTPIVDSKVEKQEGVATKVNWKFEIINKSLIPRSYLKVDEVAIGQVVRALKRNTNIPGIRPYPESGISVRA